MSKLIYNQGTATVVIPSGSSLAVFTRDQATIRQLVVNPNQPPSFGTIGTALDGIPLVLGPFANATTVEIAGSAGETYYSVGTAPTISEVLAAAYQPAPSALNVTGSLTSAAILSGIVTSTSAASVGALLPTGAVLDAANSLDVNGSFDWSVINTGPSAFTVSAAANHTIVGAAVVATATSGIFRTRKTAAGTFITYRLA